MHARQSSHSFPNSIILLPRAIMNAHQRPLDCRLYHVRIVGTAIIRQLQFSPTVAAKIAEPSTTCIPVGVLVTRALS
jgi:hypothetical protein